MQILQLKLFILFQTEVALIYDAIMLFKLGVKDLVNKKGSFTKALPTAKCNGKKSLGSEHLGTELTQTMLRVSIIYNYTYDLT